MASYVLKHSRTTLSGITSLTYNTETALLTTAASHLYIIKSVKQILNIASTGGAITGMGSALLLSDTDGTSTRALVSLRPYVTSAGVVTNTSVQHDWASPMAGGNMEAFIAAPTQAVSSATHYGFRSSCVRDLHMEAGQALFYSPRDQQGTLGWAVATSLSASITFDISYIDYTL